MPPSLHAIKLGIVLIFKKYMCFIKVSVNYPFKNNINMIYFKYVLKKKKNCNLFLKYIAYQHKQFLSICTQSVRPAANYRKISSDYS